MGYSVIWGDYDSKINKTLVFICLVLAIIIVLTVFQLLDSHAHQSYEYVYSEGATGRNGIKYILYWNSFWENEDFHLGFGSEIFKDCLVKNCFATKDKNLMPVEEFDALVFHGVQYHERSENNPRKRNPNQVYIYFNLESPFNTPSDLKFSYGFFNWTVSYRNDADIFRPYGWIIRNSTGYKMATIEEIQKRPKKIAWFVSHCEAASQRDLLAQKIGQHMQLDVYGACGNLTCPKTKRHECYDMMEHNYKFYFSFENAVCKDYVTEKMFDALKLNVVPIVYGGADYDNIAPPLSVIDVTKYKTVEQLVDILKFLDENPEEYLKYFEWKKDFVPYKRPQATICQLCRKLNEPRKITFYEDITAWVYYPSYCKSGNQLPSIVSS